MVAIASQNLNSEELVKMFYFFMEENALKIMLILLLIDIFVNPCIRLQILNTFFGGSFFCVRLLIVKLLCINCASKKSEPNKDIFKITD